MKIRRKESLKLRARMSKLLAKKWIYFAALTLPVLLFHLDYFTSGSNLLDGDFDYYAQLYEAFRVSVVKFHELPLWNPWQSGGMPLLANPQFGLISIQSIFVLIFGTIVGLKLAYVSYAAAGFWGMYILTRRDAGSSKLRAALLGYIWVFCGFFASHNISHFTFALFFLLPWFIYFLNRWRNRLTWLYLGSLISLVILSSIHYAFLMTSLSMLFYFGFFGLFNKAWRGLTKQRIKQAVLFALKSGLVVIVLSGYRLVTTYLFVSNNQRPAGILTETAPTLGVLIKGLFFPVGTLLRLPTTHWSWGEYSAYVGMGAGCAFLFISGLWAYKIVRRNPAKRFNNKAVIYSVIALGVLAFVVAKGDFGTLSPFNLLHYLPGFAETRVSSRWLLVTAFSVLIFIGAWRKNEKIINVLLVLSVVELFISFGPRNPALDQGYVIPKADFSRVLRQYDNDRLHKRLGEDINRSYYYATTRNRGQLYGDDSIINTLNNVLPTVRCGENKNLRCDFVLSDNAKVVSWAPNRIVLERTGPGAIELNMNREAGWRINQTYPFWGNSVLNPSLPFVFGDNNEVAYTLQYAPRFSPNWLGWKISSIGEN